jgi:hypothetical protein
VCRGNDARLSDARVPTIHGDDKHSVSYATDANLSSHTGDSTIHFVKSDVSKTDVGLSNVDNVQQIPLTQKGVANGVATLDATGKVPAEQIDGGMEIHGDEYHSVNYLPKTGGVMTGNIDLNGNIVQLNNTSYAYSKLNDVSGNVFLGAHGTLNLLAGNLYALQLSSTLITMHHNLDADSNSIINLADPSSAQDAATKSYVDTQISNINSFIPKTVRFDGVLSAGNAQQFSTLEVNATLTTVRVVLRGSLPVGASIKVQVTKNGASPTDSVLTADEPIELLTTATAESNGLYVVEGTLDSGMTTCSALDWFQATITQVGSDYAGNDLDVQLVFE